MKRLYPVLLTAFCLLIFAACRPQIRNCKVTFMNEEAVFATREEAEGETLELASLTFPQGAPQRASDEEYSYSFSGWSLLPNGTKLERIQIVRDVTLYALYERTLLKPQEEEFTVTFVMEDGGVKRTLSTQKVKKGEKAIPPDMETLAPEGHSFVRWDKDPQTTPIEGRTEFVALFERNEYRLTEHLLGETDSVEVEYGADVLLSPPTLPSALKFEGWFSDEACTQAFSEEKMPAHDLDIYAKVLIDLSEARLEGEDLVYGSAQVFVGGLKEADGLTYSFEWSGGCTGESCTLPAAGENRVSVTVKANYRGILRAEKRLEADFSVAGKPIAGTLTVGDLVYGEQPQPQISFEGLLPGETLSPTYRYFDERGGEQSFPLSAGNYTVKAEWDSPNYLSEEISASFTVTKRPLTVIAAAEDVVYGTNPLPYLSYEGFVSGENENDLKTDESKERFSYQKEGAPYGEARFTAGDYTVSVTEGYFSAENYDLSFTAGNFSVGKARMTLSVELSPSQIVYGENFTAQITHTPFIFQDETEEQVFGKNLSAVISGAPELLPAGEYTVTAEYEQPENYEVEMRSAALTVLKRQVTVSLPAVHSVYGEQAVLPAPSVEGLLPQESALGEKLRLSYAVNGGEIGRFLPAGSYSVAVSLENGEQFPNYAFRCEPGTLTVSKRNFAIVTGEVSRNRDSLWSFTPRLTDADDALFEIEGTLLLDTREAGTYRATDASGLEKNHFRWSPALKITRRGEDVTENFEISYDLNVTLNNSHFSVTVPSADPFVYDGAEHTFAVEVSPDGADEITPSVSYSVNGGERSERAPSLKNAGRYEISCTISAENYDTEQRSFTVEISKARYTVTGASPLAEDYDGKAHGAPLTVSGVAGEDVSDCLHVHISYTPYFGAGGEVVGFSNIVNAGQYEISYSVYGNDNYEDVPRASYTIAVGRLSYKVEAEETQNYVYTPNMPHGKGIKVKNVIDGNEYTVSYSHNGAESQSAPTFTNATEGERVSYTVSEGVNYEKKEGTYLVTVAKAQGTLDVSGIEKHYVYNGAEQRVESGAVANNKEDGEIAYEDNAFTTVAEGNALAVKVKLSEGKNYTAAEETVTGFTVEKQTLTKLPAGVAAPAPEVQINRVGKTLDEVPLPDRFRWEAGGESLVLGGHSYRAVYLGDENVNDFALDVSFTTRKERCTLSFVGGEGDFRLGATEEDYTLAFAEILGEDGEKRTAEQAYLSLQTDGAKINFARGSAYPVSCTAVLSPNQYFEVEGALSATVPFKLKSVEYGGALYTVEDALYAAQTGTVTVKFDTAFMDADARSALPEISKDACRTVRSGVTLLVPYSESDSGSTAQNAKQTWSAVSGGGYVTLTLPQGAQLNVEGKLVVNGLRSSDSQRTSMIVGGNYGNLHAESGATLFVKQGGVFESMGFSYGEGEAVIESGGQVFEPFAMVGWKGGSISAAIRNDVFPLNQYTLSSLVMKTTFRAGANYSVRASLTATLSLLGGEKNLDLAVSFLGSDESAFLELKEGEVVKRVNEANGKICFEAAGEVTFHNLELKLNDTIKFNTSGLQVPVPGNFDIRIRSGGSASVPDKVALKLLPGASVSVDAGAELTVASGGSVLGYGEGTAFDGVAAWQDGGNGLSYPHASMGGAYRKAVGNFGYQKETPATLRVGGTLTVTGGGTLACEIAGEENAVVSLEEGCLLEKRVKEDKTPAITSTTDKIKALAGQGGSFFEATLKISEGLAAGKRYVYHGGFEEAQP